MMVGAGVLSPRGFAPPAGAGAPGAPGAAPDGAAEGWGARALGGAGSLPFSASCGPAFMPEDPAGMETCNGRGPEGGAGGGGGPRT